MFSFKPNIEYHQQAEETEQQIIERAKNAVESSSWVVGECAAKWCERFASGRTDADFADLIGESQQSVNFKRRVYERFGDFTTRVVNLSYSHYRAAISWHDPEEWLEQASNEGWSVAEMRRARADHYDTESDQDEDECTSTNDYADSETESLPEPQSQTPTKERTGATQPTSGGTTDSVNVNSENRNAVREVDERDGCKWSTWIREAQSYKTRVESSVRVIDDNKDVLGWKHGDAIGKFRKFYSDLNRWIKELEELQS